MKTLLIVLILLNVGAYAFIAGRPSTLDQATSSYTKELCLDMDYQAAHPQPSKCVSNELCVTAPINPSIRYYKWGSQQEIGEINCEDYEK